MFVLVLNKFKNQNYNLYIFYGIFRRSSTKTFTSAWSATINPGIVTTIISCIAVGGGASANVGIYPQEDGTGHMQVTPNMNSSGVVPYPWLILGIT